MPLLYRAKIKGDDSLVRLIKIANRTSFGPRGGACFILCPVGFGCDAFVMCLDMMG